VFLLAVSYLLSDRFREAEESMRRMDHIDPLYPPYVQLKSFLNLKAAPDMQSAMAGYIDVLAKNPNDRQIRKSISLLRRARNFQAFQRDARLADFVDIPSWKKGTAKRRPAPVGSRAYRPGAKIRIRHKKAAVFILVVIVAFSLTAAAFYLFNNRHLLSRTGPVTPDGDEWKKIEQVTIDVSGFSLIEKINKSKTPEFYYSNDTLAADFNRAKLLVKAGKYNDSLLLLNRIYHSNATFSVKERVELLRKFVMGIEDREYGGIAYSDVKAKPYLYLGTSVKWNGRVANAKRREGKLIFNFLVGYRAGDVFEGIVDVYSDCDYEKIGNGDTVSLKAVITQTIGGDNRLYLSAREIQKL
jgi:tetratricopeptide (TPR) repeat protein